MIAIGTDIVEVGRVEAAWRRHGDRFVRRVLTPAERRASEELREPWRHLAKRFAAKEAIAKAFGTGIGGELGFHDMQITRQASGAPRVDLSDRGATLLRRLGGSRVLISLSDERAYAVAFAVVLA